MAAKHGDFVWYELMTTDDKAAKAFYSSVVGWTAKGVPMPNHPGQEYTLLNAGEDSVAGLMAMPPGAEDLKPAWIGYVGVDDVDASAAKAKAAGGTVAHEPSDIPGVGRFAIIADPSGAHLGLMKWADAGMETKPPQMKPGYNGWHELYGGEPGGSLDFYSRLFGWEKQEAMDMGPMGTYQIFGQGGRQVGGMMKKPQNLPVTFWNYYFIVDDIEAAIERVKAAGGQVLMGPQEVPGGGRIIQGLDPQGATFSLVG